MSTTNAGLALLLLVTRRQRASLNPKTGLQQGHKSSGPALVKDLRDEFAERNLSSSVLVEKLS